MLGEAVVHSFKSSADSGAAEWLIHTLMLAARDDIEISSISLPTPSYLMLAFSCGVDEPEAQGRHVMRVYRLGRSVDWARAGSPPPTKEQMPMVRVGATFRIQGPGGPITITEDTEATT